MTNEQQQFLSAFENKVLRLKSQYEEKVRENEALKGEIEELKHRNTALQYEIEGIHSEIDSLKMAGSVVSDSTDLSALKDRVSLMVREIDGCIALLND